MKTLYKSNRTMLSKGGPEKSLTFNLKKWAGRTNNGRVTVRHRGAGVKKLYRIIDFGQRVDMPAKVVSLEYDPNRTGYIALMQYPDGQKSYVLASSEMKVGDEVVCAEKAELKSGNRMKLRNIPVGQTVYNIELEPGSGGKVMRGAGSSAKVLAQEERYTNLELPSGEIRKFPAECFASVGMVSNAEHAFVRTHNAGRKRKKGWRPVVRGKVMNPCDHPHGGGEGNTSTGLKHPKTPWGKNAFGVKTRKRKKWTNKLIMQGRKRR